ncbi:SRPBCC domain-containing protein [uncultured Brevundimonas sp.]|uniref:SRPBCC domain-containing protein n=1 Tax=uncultured Brevundimonas sp. TaxID=213418 RepID=UPI0030EC892A|tara:strand:+ start:3166 stop:3618 length:453 start_codon:yes stop_codon:yes gene_type:complete
MELKFEVSTRVGRPVHEVFEAVADPARLSSYFTTGGAVGRLETGATVQWDFADFPGAFPVEVIEVVPDQRIVLRWAGKEGLDDGRTTVTMTFTPLDDGTRTLVTIAEARWKPTPAGLKASYGNCAGWTEMLAALKAWVEYDINLRQGAYS